MNQNCGLVGLKNFLTRGQENHYLPQANLNSCIPALLSRHCLGLLFKAPRQHQSNKTAMDQKYKPFSTMFSSIIYMLYIHAVVDHGVGWSSTGCYSIVVPHAEELLAIGKDDPSLESSWGTKVLPSWTEVARKPGWTPLFLQHVVEPTCLTEESKQTNSIQDRLKATRSRWFLIVPNLRLGWF